MGLSEQELREQSVFVGDSPNDEPMFEYFDNSIGVANVREFESRLKYPPQFVTSESNGLGFAEVANSLKS